MRHLTVFGGLVLVLVGAAAAISAPINVVAYGTTGPNVIDFEDVAAAAFPGVNYDGILTSGGATLAERFVGQTLSFSGDLDVLSGLPSGPLALQVGAAGENLAVGTDTGTNGLYPWGPKGAPLPDGYGEGSFAVLFSGDVSNFGFESFFGAGTTTVQFFRADGSLIDSVVVAGVGTFGFARDGGLQDIRGVSVHTSDAGGLGYDNFRYGDVDDVVPEPASIVLFGLGLVGLGGLARRRNRAAS